MKVLVYTFSDLFERYLQKVMAETGVAVQFHNTNELREPFRSDDTMAWSRDQTLHVYLNPDLSPILAEVLAAHELTHEVLTTEGYPVTRLAKGLEGDAGWQNVRSRLMSSILNVVVNRRLDRFGFDLTAYRERGTSNLGKKLASIDPRIITADAMRLNALVYLDYYLDGPQDGAELMVDFLKRVPPPQWQLCQGVVSIIKGEALETPRQCLNALIKIRDYLGFRNLIFVVDPRKGVYY